MKATGLILFLLFFFTNCILAQNLVPNPGFEIVSEVNNNWVKGKSEFNTQMRYWSSPNFGSPDILFTQTIDNMSPVRKGVDMSQHKPRSGNVMAGIKTYGCKSNNPH